MRPAIIAGIAGVALGFVAVLDHGVAGLFDLDYLFVTLVGVLAGTMGIYYLSLRRGKSRELTTFDDPERRYRAVIPGDDIDRRIETISMESRFRVSQRRIRDQLRNAAVRALIVHAGYDRETAREAVDEGTWTDDPVAATFLAQKGQYPTRMRFKAFFGRLDPSVVGARRSVEAIVAVIDS